jgi:hypothetical protein
VRPHSRALVDRRNPRAWGVCDRCGFTYNLDELQYQYIWAGARTARTNSKVCWYCMDVLQEQIRSIVLPADPVPVENPRPERYLIADNPISSIGTSIGTMIQGGGLNAAFDSNPSKPFAWCAASYTSILGVNNIVGRNWGNSPVVVASFTLIAPNNAPFLGSGATSFAFQGSNSPVPISFTTLATGSTVGTIGEIITVTLVPATAYQYHQIVLNGDGTSSIAICQLQINQAG